MNASNPTLLIDDKMKLASHGKRKIMPLAFDQTGLRTTKTATWEALDKVLAVRAVPDHLPDPAWMKNYDALVEERLQKNLPLPVGKRFKQSYTANYNEVRW
jgi:hypothetical protein